jgi:DNA-binding transcriptional LysR family regulator
MNSNLEELLLILRIAALVDSGHSLNSASEELGVSPSTASALLDRIGEQFPVGPIFVRRPGAKGGTDLTPAGKELLNTVVRAFDRFAARPREFVVACSHSLITDQIITPVIAEFQGRQRPSEISLSLRIESKLHFSELLSMIDQGKVHLAFVWGPAERLRDTKLPRTVTIEVLTETAFDLVFVAHDPETIRTVDSLLQSTSADKPANSLNQHLDRRLFASLKTHLRGLRAVMLPSDSQPLSTLFPQRDPIGAVQVDTYDAAIEIVRAKAADFALVPALYPVLQRSRLFGQLFFSQPVSTLPIAILSGESTGADKIQDNLIRGLKNRLATFTRERAKLLHVTPELPSDLKEYRRLKYGYFIDIARPGDVARLSFGRQAYVWKGQMLTWNKDSSPNSLDGSWRNVDGNIYRIHAERHRIGFVVTAEKELDARPDEGLPYRGFISTFTIMHTESKSIQRHSRSGLKLPLRLFGTWTASDDDYATTYASVLSEDRLTLKDLTAIQESVKYRAILSSDFGIGLEHLD